MKKDIDYLSILKQAGLRATEPRLAILKMLCQASCPLSETDINRQLGNTAPNKTTIYRTLETLVAKNIVHQAYIQNRQRYFEIAANCSTAQCHPHFTCVRCHRTECLYKTAWQPATPPAGYVVFRQQIRIEGLCATCSIHDKTNR